VAEAVQADRGDVILSGLMKIVLFLLIVFYLVFEIAAVTVNQVQLDDAAQTAARLGAQALRDRRGPAGAEEAVQQPLPDNVTLEGISIAGDEVTVTATRAAAVLLLDRLGPLAQFATSTVTATAGPPTGL
jgi:Flp pilus assembly protein TadG